MDIVIKKGLDIPLTGEPAGNAQSVQPAGEASDSNHLTKVALDVRQYETLRFRRLKKSGDTVKIGEPILEDKGCPGRMFVSPAHGVIEEVRRGEKRRILDVVIRLQENEEHFERPPLDPASSTKEQIIERLLDGGAFARIYRRPFHILARPDQSPSATFVKAIESAPYAVPPEMQVEGYEEIFQTGLDTLAKLTDGPVHLVYKKDSECQAFTKAVNVQKHTAKGPHPAGTHSLHIQKIRPIFSAEEVVWTVDVLDVLVIGRLMKEGKLHIDRIVSIAGPALIEGQTGYFRTREGVSAAYLTNGRLPKNPVRLISGDPLMGTKIGIEDYLGVQDSIFTVIAEPTQREFLHFFRLGLDKYSYSGAYFSPKKKYAFTTSQHGEKRAFIDPALYDEVQALDIPTMQLVKAIMAEDIELAEELGLYEIAPEDFALPSFVCPSKIDMTHIVKEALKEFAAELVH